MELKTLRLCHAFKTQDDAYRASDVLPGNLMNFRVGVTAKITFNFKLLFCVSLDNGDTYDKNNYRFEFPRSRANCQFLSRVSATIWGRVSST